MNFLNYIVRYFVARSLWNATHPAHRPARTLDYAWQDGDEIRLVGRGRFVFRNGQFVGADEPKEGTDAAVE